MGIRHSAQVVYRDSAGWHIPPYEYDSTGDVLPRYNYGGCLKNDPILFGVWEACGCECTWPDSWDVPDFPRPDQAETEGVPYYWLDLATFDSIDWDKIAIPDLSERWAVIVKSDRSPESGTHLWVIARMRGAWRQLYASYEAPELEEFPSEVLEIQRGETRRLGELHYERRNASMADLINASRWFRQFIESARDLRLCASVDEVGIILDMDW